MRLVPKGIVPQLFFHALITGRTTLAVSSLAVPLHVLRTMRVPGDGTPAPMFLRMFGIRNGLLALGLTNLDHIKNPKRFVALNVITDFIDALAFVDAGRRGEVTRTGATVTTAIAMSAVAAGLITWANLPDAPEMNSASVSSV